MLKNYVPSKWCKITEYQLVFDDRRHNGFGFPCDANGNLLQNEEDNPESYKNLHWCLEHPNEFERFNEVVKYTRNVEVCFTDGNNQEWFETFFQNFNIDEENNIIEMLFDTEE